MPLTTEIIEDASPGLDMKRKLTDKPYKLYDSSGLFLLISPTGGKWWRFKYRYGGKENQLSVGTYPLVSLAEARSQRETFRELLATGIDPSHNRQKEKMAKLVEEARLLAATRFTLESDGGLSIRLDKRRIALTPTETEELRSFLNTTRKIVPKETPCL